MLAIVCGCGASTRQTTIRTALIAANAANAGFASWDGSHQLEIVRSAQSKAESDAALAAYRARRHDVILAFVALYQAIATAGALSDDASLKTVVEVSARLQKLIGAIEVTP